MQQPNEVKFSYDENISFWCSTTDYFYPATGGVDFMAYTCGAKTPTSKWTMNEDEGIKDLTLTFANGTLDGQTDVMASKVTSVACPTQQTTSLVFKHALSWLVVRVGASVASQVKIHSVKVLDAAFDGTVKVTVPDAKNEDPTFQWTPGTKAERNFPNYLSAEGQAIHEIDNNDINGILVVPGPQTKLQIDYSMANDGYTQHYIHTINLADVEDGQPIPTWEPGWRYVYVVSFNLQNITFHAAVDKWEGQVFIPETIDNTKPATPQP